MTVFQSKDASHKSQENKKQFDICNNYGIKISDDLADILTCEVVLDALFGIGLSRDITGENAQLLEKVNAIQAFRLAVDMPSGISADDGTVLGTAFMADATVTFAFAKVGQMVYPGKNTVVNW